MPDRISFPPPSREALAAFFQPRNIALVGASDRSAWSKSIFLRFGEYGHQGKLFAVNLKGIPAHGLPGYTSIGAIPEKIDTAYIYLAANAVIPALREAAAAGIRNAVVLSSGFAEAGEQGAVLQTELAATAAELGMMLLGPNSLGFANFGDKAFCTAMRSRLPVREGGLALISQSGAVGFELAKWAHVQGIGLSFLCATGNESQLGIADIVEYLVDDPATKAIAVYLEGINDPARFVDAAARARAARKPVVLLKIGRSEVSNAVAQAHTGSMVGDDKVFDAMCRRYGVTRVSSIEELISTADALGRIGPINPPRIGMVSVSGGACGMYADLAHLAELAVPPWSASTQAALREVLPSFAATLNPLDITGVAVQTPALWADVIPRLAADETMGLIVVGHNFPNTIVDRQNLEATFTAIAEGYGKAGKPPVILSYSVQDMDEVQEQLRKDLHIDVVLPNLDFGVRALAHLQRWSEVLLTDLPPTPDIAATDSRPEGERAVLDYLKAQGVPVIPAHVATSRDDAVVAADGMNYPVVLKIASPDIAHKTEAGGVRLNLTGAPAVREAYDAIVASAQAYAPDARIDGVLVSPMRGPAAELIVAVARDPQWGPALVVGLGGVFTELLQDSQLRLLPVTPAEVREMLEGLRGAKLLTGFRGGPAADLDALAATIAAIGNAAIGLGPQLAALEVNPLRVDGGLIECLDGLAIYQED